MDRRREVVGECYVPVGGPGWRGPLISHAPQLGRMVMALSCPRSTRHAPTAPLTRGSGVSCRSEPGILSARTLRGSDSASPVAEEKPDGSEAIALPLPVEEGGNGRRPCDFGKPCHGAQQRLGGVNRGVRTASS